MSPRCEHGNYADKCPVCIQVELETVPDNLQPLGESGTQVDLEGSPTILYREFWDERDGNTYDIMTDGAVVGIYHRSVDGVKVPAGIFWAMVGMLEDEGVRP